MLHKSLEIDKLWNFSNPADTEIKFRELLEKDTSTDKNYRYQIITQIARTLGLQEKFDDGHKILDEIQLDEINDLTKIRYLLERGRLYNSSGDKEKAKTYFHKALELGRSTDFDTYTIDAAHMMAIVEQDPDDQLKWNLQSIELTEKSSQESAKKWMGSLYNNTGWSLFDKGEYEEALVLFDKTLAFRVK